MMLAHYHGGIVNYPEIGKSLDLSQPTVKKYIGFLESTFLVRLIKPFHSNAGRRLVKSPKVYLTDSGIFHFFLGIETLDQLYGHPKIGVSWEGFAIEQIISALPVNCRYYFYRTHDGAELDLVITRGDKPVAGIEIKFGLDIRVSRGNTEALRTLAVSNKFIVIREDEDYLLSDGFRVIGLAGFISKHIPTI